MARERGLLLRLLGGRQAARTVGPLTHPVDDATTLHRRGAAPEVKLLLFGSGPAAGWGVHLHDLGLGGGIADRLAERMGHAVALDLLVDDSWQDPDPITAIRTQGLGKYHAVVIVGAYNHSLIEVPEPVWKDYLAQLREAILQEAGPDVALLVLSLPWDDAAERMPSVWGGPAGRAVVDLARIADETLSDSEQITQLRLLPPIEAEEWIGPDFSVASYARWSADTADRLAPLLGAGAVLSLP
ncbi:hypothetical protein [uncultured Amnibacterium sp.]|uniref:hypothetical protein n=1 Tax=uncultured Amnibacterium sp. TaxID=1631851 RepID=UPI0035CC5DDE